MLNSIVQGDALNIIKQIDEKTIDLIITSPPYENIKTAAVQDVCYQCGRVLKDGGIFFLQLKDKQNLAVNDVHLIIERTQCQSPLKLWTTCIIYRDLPHKIMRGDAMLDWFDPVYIFVKADWPKTYLSNHIEDTVWTNYRIPRRCESYIRYKYEPFPELMVHHIIQDFSIIGDTVLDPYCGVGTVPFVAKSLGRNYIGIDIDRKCCEVSRFRLKYQKEE